MGELFINGSKITLTVEDTLTMLEPVSIGKEPIMLIIIDSNAEHRDPIPYWDEPSHHGCPPTKRRVELNEDDSVDIYEGDTHIRHLTVEEQKALRDA